MRDNRTRDSLLTRARVTLWTRDGIRLSSYTCLTSEAMQRAIADADAEGGGAYATVTFLDGSAWFRVPERDGVVSAPNPDLKLL